MVGRWGRQNVRRALRESWSVGVVVVRVVVSRRHVGVLRWVLAVDGWWGRVVGHGNWPGNVLNILHSISGVEQIRRGC